MAIEILKAGPLCTVQDGGRTGFQALGYQESGAMDKYAMYSANILAGNTENDRSEAVLEMTLTGITACFDSDIIIALSGADMSPVINGKPVPTDDGNGRKGPSRIPGRIWRHIGPACDGKPFHRTENAHGRT